MNTTINVACYKWKTLAKENDYLHLKLIIIRFMEYINEFVVHTDICEESGEQFV